MMTILIIKLNYVLSLLINGPRFILLSLSLFITFNLSIIVVFPLLSNPITRIETGFREMPSAVKRRLKNPIRKMIAEM